MGRIKNKVFIFYMLTKVGKFMICFEIGGSPVT